MAELSCCYKALGVMIWLASPAEDEQLEWHSRGQRFDPAYLHQEKPEIERFRAFFCTFWGFQFWRVNNWVNNFPDFPARMVQKGMCMGVVQEKLKNAHKKGLT